MREIRLSDKVAQILKTMKDTLNFSGLCNDDKKLMISKVKDSFLKILGNLIENSHELNMEYLIFYVKYLYNLDLI